MKMADTSQREKSSNNIAPLIGGYLFLDITTTICILYIL